MAQKTSDEWIKDSMKQNPKLHVGYAKKFISNLYERLKRPGTTAKDRTRIYKKMRGFNRIGKKFKSGKGL